MTWTSIREEFKPYEGILSPADVGRALLNAERKHDLALLKAQDSYLSQFHGGEPWYFPIPNDDWNTFWKSAYDLKNKPKSEWTEDDYFAYRALDWFCTFAWNAYH